MTNQTKTITKRKEYTLNYQQHNKIKQIAFIAMQTHNIKEYNKDKQNKRYLKYQQTLQLLYKTKTQIQLEDLIDRYINYTEKLENKKQQEHNQEIIIIPKLHNLTEKQLEHITYQIQQLEQKYYLQLDTDYNSPTSILQSYQQLLYYKKYNIELQPKPKQEYLIGNLELLDNPNINTYQEPITQQDIVQQSQDYVLTIERNK